MLYKMLLFLLLPFLSIAQKVSIIPIPEKMEIRNGFFTFNASTKIFFQADIQSWEKATQTFKEQLRTTSGFLLKTATTAASTNCVSILKSPNSQIDGAYELNITPSSITISASDETGVFYATQTLLQLLPESVFLPHHSSSVKWQIPALHIQDKPVLAYRGLMLDVARHFLPLEYIRKLIDVMALQKMNTLHLHLTDDQGWRMEIKRYPKLTDVGSVRSGTLIDRYPGKGNDQIEHKGYYTQQELKALVAYAALKHITIIPEIELPGHSSAAIAAYPQLSCFPDEPTVAIKEMTSDKAFERTNQKGGKIVQETWGVFHDVFCPTPFTFSFLEGVFDEVLDVFPSRYIHIGGDECPKDSWKRSVFCQDLIRSEKLKDEHELQSYFIKRIEQYLNGKGRSIIGWDEILEGGLAPNATVMSWRGISGGIDAAKQGHDVIMSPVDFCYLNLYQSEDPTDSIAWGGLLPLKKVFEYNPFPSELEEKYRKHIKGIQANLWSEYIKTPDLASFMLFPRVLAIAETGWSLGRSNIDDFTGRVTRYFPKLEAMGIHHSNHLYDIGFKTTFNASKNFLSISLHGVPTGRGLHFAIHDSVPVPYNKPVDVTGSGLLNGMVMTNGKITDKKQIKFNIVSSTGRSVSLDPFPDAPYNKGGMGAWTNGIWGSEIRYTDDEWLGWNGKDFNGVLDFGETKELKKLSIRLFNAPGNWVYLPTAIQMLISDDGKTYYPFQKWDITEQNQTKVQRFEWMFSSVKTRFVKIIATHAGTIPSGKPGAGNPAWLFVDEVELQ